MKEHFAPLFEKKHPFVFFRLPNQNKVQCYFQETSTAYHTTDYSSSGFVFAPFEKTSTYLMIPDILRKEFVFTPQAEVTPKPIPNFLNDKVPFTDRVKAAKKIMQQQVLRKVVLSNPFLVDNAFSYVESFENLLSLYPTAFVYLFYHPTTGLWMGASPERLFSISNNTLQTVALAGTIHRWDSKAQWTEKEFEEQQMVTDHIVAALSQSKALGEIMVDERQTVNAGNLQHLCTSITAELNDYSLNEIIEKLHPTPAVGGFPTVEATQVIHALEQYDRTFYTGFLGPFDQQKKVDFFVNLRCCRWEEEQIYIFSGAGITAKSNPEMEWEEICRKVSTIYNALR